MERRTQANLLISSLINRQEAKYVKPLTIIFKFVIQFG